MRQTIYTLYIIIATIILLGCGGKSEFRQTLESLDSVLVSRPDSVYDVLNKLEPQKQSETDRMYYELLRADAQNKAYIDFTTDSVMKIVADYYDHHGTANEQMRAHYLLGCTYRDLQDVPMELQCFQEAVEKADTTKRDCDLYTLAAIYGQMADLYHSQFLPDEELKALDLCEKIAKQDKDTLTAIKSYALKIRPYFLLGNQDNVLKIIKNARNKYIKYNKVKESAQLLGPGISILLDRNDIDSARIYMDIFEKESGFVVNGNIVSTKAKMYYKSKGQLCLMQNQIDSARYYFKELQKAGWEEAAYEGFVHLYKKTNNPDSLAKYANLFVIANDSARASTSSELIAQMTAMYDYTRHQHAAQQEAKKAANMQRTLLVYIVISLIVLGIIVLVTLRFKKAKEEKIELAKSQLEKSQLMLQIAQQQLDVLALDKEASQALYQEKQEEIRILSERIVHYESQLQDRNLSRKNVELQQSFIVTKMKDMCLHGKWDDITNDDWQKLAQTTESIYPGFHSLVNRYESLAENEYRICMMIVAGFNPTDMDNLLGMAQKYSSTIRRRLNKKVFQTAGSAKDFDQRLQKMLQSGNDKD